ncbi:MAG: AbrB family transcriptional regulator, partial [Rubrivivax sp.]
MGVTLSGQVWSAIPSVLSNAAQLVIGVSLGVRFTPAFMHTAPRWLGSVALASLVMMGVCALFGWGLAQLIGQHPATMILGTSPGGIAEMCITAKVLQLGVPTVTAMHVVRYVVVLVATERLWRWEARRLGWRSSAA